jgi:hypothetical protein
MVIQKSGTRRSVGIAATNLILKERAPSVDRGKPGRLGSVVFLKESRSERKKERAEIQIQEGQRMQVEKDAIKLGGGDLGFRSFIFNIY